MLKPNDFGFNIEIPKGIQTLEGALVNIKVDRLENGVNYSSIYIY
jgi:hypothetical protein